MALANSPIYLGLILGLAGCAGGSPPANPPTADPAPVELPKDRMAGQKVYDAGGKELICAPPDRSCTPGDVPLAFKDECRLAGFRIMQCGCSNVCTGRRKGSKSGYDADSREKPCPPEQKDCSPPDTSAAFQAACTESGHKLMVCGREWLCKGKLKHPVSGTAPVD